MASLTDGSGSEALRATALTKVIPYLPPASQSSSLLIQLPIELRLMVLRYLLISETQIGYRRHYENPILGRNKARERKRNGDSKGQFVEREPEPKRTMEGYHVTPSVIRTCQHIFAEALPILYNKNFLCIKIVANAYRSPMSYYEYPLDVDGRFHRADVRAAVSVFGNERILSPIMLGGRSHNEDLASLARQFRNFTISIDINADVRQLAEVRQVFRIIAPIFYASNVKTIICETKGSLLPPQSTISTTQTVALMKAFTLLRCASFHFSANTDPIAKSVQDVITGSTPILDLEILLPNAGRMLKTMLFTFENVPTKLSAVHTLVNRLAEAVGDFNVVSFLQARLEILQIWQSHLARKEQVQLELRNPYSQDMPTHVDVDFRLMTMDYERFNLCDSVDIGLKVKEDGRQLNAELRDLAKQHRFSPIFDSQEPEYLACKL